MPHAPVTPLHAIAERGPVLAVVAHPDDESFGLGAVLAAVVAAGGEVRVVCLTHGEASTLGTTAGLGAVRAAELAAAAARLGVAATVLHDFADGHLATVEPAALDAAVEAALGHRVPREPGRRQPGAHPPARAAGRRRTDPAGRDAAP